MLSHRERIFVSFKSLTPNCVSIRQRILLKKAGNNPALFLGAANETRTRDPDLGKVVLYQLSYCRIM